ncbi:MAG: hypothetical protein WBV82_23735 [Myxococcaceae bacterium]
MRFLPLLLLVCALFPRLAMGAEEVTSFALIVSNNASLSNRPALQYADDDGAKYYAVFAGLMPERNVLLLTDFDRDTARIFPELAPVAQSPSRANLDEAVRLVAARVRDVQRGGGTAELYFVYAGHGDVDEGRGFLELRDSRLSSDDLEKVLQSVGADTSHVILDSCNSFFVVNPRGPGGRRFATPKDAAERLSKRFPNVGVLLSTSAEADVYEWSELQSGIFSHAVRSGLTGAADANTDGRVTYEELSAFVDISASEVRNPLYRPKVYARGPGGDDTLAMARLAAPEQTVVLTLDAPEAVRIALRDAEGLRWVDAHKEDGSRLRLTIPVPLARRMTVEVMSGVGDSQRVQARYAMPSSPGTFNFASLSMLAASSTSGRGADDIFLMLFASPFGPNAMARYRVEKAEGPEPVYGISLEDSQRMHLLLGQLSDFQASNRRVAAIGMLAVGAGSAAWGGYLLLDRNRPGKESSVTGYSLGALGLLTAGVGTWALLSPSEAELTFRDFAMSMAQPGVDPSQVVAATELRLNALLEEERSSRMTIRLVSGIGMSAAAVGTVAMLLDDGLRARPQDEREQVWLTTGYSAVLFATTFAYSFVESPTERLIRLWLEDPGIQQIPRISVGVIPGGGSVSLSGEF